jgi:phosphinothricin acetyltransferase
MKDIIKDAMKDSMKIRFIRPADHAGVLDIYRPFVEHTAITFDHEVPSAAAFSGHILAVSAFYPWLVAEINGGIAGYAYAGKHRARKAYQWSVESSVYISEDHHRSGIGKTLYETLFHLLRLQGIVNVYAGVTLPNEKSERFHAAMGFEPVGIYKRVGYKLGRWHDVSWMSLSLGAYDRDPAPPLSIKEIEKSVAYKDLFTG